MERHQIPHVTVVRGGAVDRIDRVVGRNIKVTKKKTTAGDEIGECSNLNGAGKIRKTKIYNTYAFTKYENKKLLSLFTLLSTFFFYIHMIYFFI